MVSGSLYCIATCQYFGRMAVGDHGIFSVRLQDTGHMTRLAREPWTISRRPSDLELLLTLRPSCGVMTSMLSIL